MSNLRNLNIEQFTEIFKALSNPNRLRIFIKLAAFCSPGTCCGDDESFRRCVGELGKHLDIGPSTLSHHIKELRQAGLIHVKRIGQRVDCWVDPKVLTVLAEFFEKPETAK